MKAFFDTTIFANPVFEYFKWIIAKIYYQVKYWGSHLRINYMAYVRKTQFGRYNYIGKNAIVIDCKIGNFTYISDFCTITNTTLGRFCSIAPNVKIAPGKHPTTAFVSTHPSTFSTPHFLKKHFTTETVYTGNIRVEIGNDVWIGANAIILDGVVIKDGAIIAANSVVAKNVDEYCIVGGSPAKFIKKRFEDGEIQNLLKMEWWNKSEDWIAKNIAKFWDIKNFDGF